MSSLGEAVLDLKANPGPLNVDMATAKQQMSDGIKGLEKTINPLSKSWTELNSAMSVYKQIEAAVTRAVEQTIGVYVKRADAVRDMMRLTGMSAEETSRLIEASDDLFVSQQTLASGFEYAVRNGYKPSAEWLKQVADQIMAIPDPADRAKKAVEIFGKAAGPEMLKLLEQGSGGLDALMASIDESMVLTDEAIIQAEEYKRAIDELNDAKSAATTAFTEPLVEPTTDFLQIAAATITGWRKILAEGKEAGDDWRRKDYEAWREHMRNIAHIAAMELLNIDAVREKEIDSATRSYMGMAKAAEKAAAASGQIGLEPDAIQDFGNLLDLTMAINDEMKDYEATMTSLRDKQAALVAKIAELESKKYLTSAQKKELAQLKNDLGDVQTEIEKTAKAHEEASNQIVFSLLMARLSADGLNEAEYEMAIAAGKALGIITDESAVGALALNGLITSFENGKISVDNFADSCSKIFDMPDEKVIDLIINTQINGPGATAGQVGVPVEPQAEGGDWFVTQPTLFLAGEAGPERATFTPMGKKGFKPAAGGGGSITVNVNGPLVGSGGLDELERRLRDIREREDRRRA